MIEKSTSDFIIEQNHELKEDLKEFILMNGSLDRAKMINIIDPIAKDVALIKEQGIKRNGRLEELENCKAEQLDLLRVEKETTFTRWMHRNPRIAIIGILIAALVFGVTSAVSYHKVDARRSIEKVLPIVLQEMETTEENNNE